MLLTIDFEEYYDKKYSIKKMSLLEYIRSPKFKVHGAACKRGDLPAEWVTAADLPDYFASIPWEQTDCLSHNANHDNTILFEKYEYSPRRRIDTLGLCRALLSPDWDFDLGTIAPLLGLGVKGDELPLSEGVRDLPPDIEKKIAEYSINDAELAYKIYRLLWPLLPQEERDVMDQTIRISTEGMLHFSPSVGRLAQQDIIADRERKLLNVFATPKQLRSREQFAELLRQRGVEPPTKTSLRTGEETYAFSKQDPEFIALLTNPDARDLVEAKLAWSSNNAINRIDRLINITSQPPFTLPVMLNYYGAHTGRASGGAKINMQNLNARGVGKRIRKAIVAPPGYVLVVRDLSGIELRMNMWFSGEDEALEIIRNGGDLYLKEAAAQFHVEESEIDLSTTEGYLKRQYGKTVQLGCGFGMGAPKFKNLCAAGPMGMEPIYLSDTEAQHTINTYRFNHPKVVGSWRWLHEVAIPLMYSQGPHDRHEHGPIVVKHEAIELPNGMSLLYNGLHSTEDGWIWGVNGRIHRIYGGITQENVVQALAAIVLRQQMLVMDKEMGADKFRRKFFNRRFYTNGLGAVVHQQHDEVISICREKDAETVLDLMGDIMSRPVSWAPGLPLDSEGGWSICYEK